MLGNCPQVDNVPLLVSMFTDSTTQTIEEMFQVFQDYDESVLCVGTTFRAANASLYAAADVAVSLSGLPGGRPLEPLPHASPAHLSAADVAFHEGMANLACALTLPSGPAAVTHTLALVREARRCLANLYQVVAFSTVLSAKLGLVVLLAKVAPVPSAPFVSTATVLFVQGVTSVFVALPMLLSEVSPNELFQTPCKNKLSAKDRSENTTRFVLYFALRAVPTVLVCVFVQIWAFGEFGAAEGSPVAAACHPPQSSHAIRWYDVVWCSALLNTEAERAAQDASEGLMAFLFVLSSCVQSSSFLYRTQSLAVLSPLKNRVWATGAVIAVLLQALYSLGRAHVLSGKAGLAWVPWHLWLLIFFWPAVALVIDEKVKAMDAQLHGRYMKFLQLEFDTRLGQYSPR